MPYNPWDYAANTAIIQRAINNWLEDLAPLGPRIAPLVPVQDRKIKKQAFEIEAFGKGKFKARDATPPIFVPTIRWTREYIELALLEEMSPIEEDEWHNLTSPDENIRNKTGIDILTRTRVLQMRNERLTEWMRFQAFQDTLTVTMGDSVTNPAQNYGLKYGIPPLNKPQATVTWLDRVNSKPISDLRAWQRMLMRLTGQFGYMVHMNSWTYENLEFSAETLAKLSPLGRTLLLAEQSDIIRLLYGADSMEGNNQSTQIIISDAGFRDEGVEDDRSLDATTLYIPDGYVLMTTPYQLDGENIADVPDGRVAVTTEGNAPLVWKQGFQTETMFDLFAKTHFTRAASARIPRLNKPKAFVWAKVFF